MYVNPTPQRPVAESSLAGYFRKRLSHAAERQRLRPQQDTFWYLGNLLDRFGRSDQLLCYHQGQLDLYPLALLYGDAVAAPNERQRCLLLRQLGDLALFVGALFPERYARHGIAQDYFVGMGGGAYDYLASNAPANRHIFGELSASFGRMLDLVASACSRQEKLTDREVVELYRQWRLSGDPALASQLRRLGISLPGSEPDD